MAVLSDAAVQNLLGTAIQDVVVKTTLTPPITLPLTDVTEGPPNPVAAFLQPTVILDTPGGPITIAPYGEATLAADSVQTWSIVGGVVLAGFAGLFLWLGYKLHK